MAIVWPLRAAHGTVVAPRDVYECARAPARRAVARRRGFAATAAPKEHQNANSAENPELTDYRGGLVPPIGARSSANNCGRGTDDTTMEPQDAPLQKKMKKIPCVRHFDHIFEFGGLKPPFKQRSFKITLPSYCSTPEARRLVFL